MKKRSPIGIRFIPWKRECEQFPIKPIVYNAKPHTFWKFSNWYACERSIEEAPREVFFTEIQKLATYLLDSHPKIFP